jgi:hypothetical protein
LPRTVTHRSQLDTPSGSLHPVGKRSMYPTTKATTPTITEVRGAWESPHTSRKIAVDECPTGWESGQCLESLSFEHCEGSSGEAGRELSITFGRVDGVALNGPRSMTACLVDCTIQKGCCDAL